MGRAFEVRKEAMAKTAVKKLKYILNMEKKFIWKRKWCA